MSRFTIANDPNAIHDNVAGEINAIDAKTSPVGADVALIEDSEDSWNKKKVPLENLIGTGGVIVMTNTTTDDTVTSLFVDGPGGSLRALIPDDTTWYARIVVTARQTAAPGAGVIGDSWVYIIDAVIENTGGTVQVLQDLPGAVYDDKDVSFDAGVDTVSSAANKALDVDVKGANGKTVNWSAELEISVVE